MSNDNFKKKRPYHEIWNNDCADPKAWQDALDFIAQFKAENVAGFRITVNKRASGSGSAPK